MSKVKIQGNASGTGVVTLTAPNTNTDRTITLPDSTGSILDSTSTLDATKLSGALPAIDGSALTGLPASGADTSLSNLSATGENRVCQAWVSAGDSAGTPTIKDSYNVSSITDNGTGDYTVNFSITMANLNYCAVAHGEKIGSVNQNGSSLSGRLPLFRTTTSYRVGNVANSTHAWNDADFNLAIFGD